MVIQDKNLKDIAETIEMINVARKKGQETWDGLLNVESYNEYKNLVGQILINIDVNAVLTYEKYKEIISEFIEINEKVEVYTLEESYGNSISEVPKSPNSSWQLYKKSLLDKGWSKHSVNNIEKSAYEILRNLSFDTRNKSAVKGLAVGNVQSGKTANMTGLIAMAADNGFNCFIILSGMIDKLREQTERRIRTDLVGEGLSNLHWKIMERGTKSYQFNSLESVKLNDESRNKLISITLKQRNRLSNLFGALQYDKDKLKQLKILILDDEADQASINTNKIDEEVNPTTINRLITEFVNNSKANAMNYVAYTATPFANILNESSLESLYPKNFITLLDPGEDYIGAKEIFGLEDPQQRSLIPITREIPESEAEDIKEMQKEGINQSLPRSFKHAIQWFLISVAALRSQGFKKPLTMLIHTSFKKNDHSFIASKIQQYLDFMKQNSEVVLSEMEKLYEKEKRSFTRTNFLESMPEYSSQDNVPDYTYWNIVKRELQNIFELPKDEYYSYVKKEETGLAKYHTGIHLSIDNSDFNNRLEDEMIRLEYPTREQEVAPAFIVVGGNTLSRGLTLEGLVTSYFLRNTLQADTLLQMARWLGYRKNYEIYPRIWLDYKALERFEFISQMNEEFREEIKAYAENGITPLDYAPRIKNSPDNALLKITAANKSQFAKGVDFNFAGFNSQTIYLENNKEILDNNLKVTKEFLNSLTKPTFPEKARMLWKEVDHDKVIEFLDNYKVCKYDRKMAFLPELIKWIQSNSQLNSGYDTLKPWNVILSSIEDIEKTIYDPSWDIHGYSPLAVTRRKKKNAPDKNIANIGVLRSPGDLLMDIDRKKVGDKNIANIREVLNIRKKNNVDQIPLLLIYRINRGTDGLDNLEDDKNKTGKIPLNFVEDAIGINVMLPGETSSGKNIVKYLSVDPNPDWLNRVSEDEEIDDAN